MAYDKLGAEGRFRPTPVRFYVKARISYDDEHRTIWGCSETGSMLAALTEFESLVLELGHTIQLSRQGRESECGTAALCHFTYRQRAHYANHVVPCLGRCWLKEQSDLGVYFSVPWLIILSIPEASNNGLTYMLCSPLRQLRWGSSNFSHFFSVW